MVEIDTVLSFIQATGIIVGVAYYILNIQNNQRNQQLSLKAQKQASGTRQGQLLMQIFKELTTDQRWKEYVSFLYDTEWTSYQDF